MDVCVLGCTPGHIPRYMGQASNNNKRCLLCAPVMPVMNSRHARYDSCDACYVFLLWPLCDLPQMLSSGSITEFQFDDYHAIPVHTCLYMLLFTARFSMHNYDSVLSLHMCLSLLATWLLPATRLGSFIWLPWILMSRFWSIGACGSSLLLIRVALR